MLLCVSVCECVCVCVLAAIQAQATHDRNFPPPPPPPLSLTPLPLSSPPRYSTLHILRSLRHCLRLPRKEVYGKRPICMKRDLYKWKETYTFEVAPLAASLSACDVCVFLPSLPPPLPFLHLSCDPLAPLAAVFSKYYVPYDVACACAHVAHVCMSCVTIWMSHVTNEPCHICMSHVTYVWVMSLCEWVMSRHRTWLSHEKCGVKRPRVRSLPIWMSHVTHESCHYINESCQHMNESRHGIDLVSHTRYAELDAHELCHNMNESRHIWVTSLHKWAVSHMSHVITWMSDVTASILQVTPGMPS